MNSRPMACRRLFPWLSAIPVLAALAAAAPAMAQRTQFHPSLGVEAAYTDNVRFVQTGISADRKDADTTNSLRVGLPLRRDWTTRSFEVSYEGVFEKHSDATELDNDAHDVRLTYSAFSGAFDKLNLTASYDHTQAQGDPTSLDSADLLVSDRTDRDLYSLGAKGQKEVGRHWHWGGRAVVSRYNLKPIPGVTLSGAPIEDRTRYHVGSTLNRVISRANALGLDYGYERFVLERSGTQDNHLLGLSFQHEPSRNYSMGAEIGLYYQTTHDSSGPQRSGTGMQGSLGFRRLLRRVDFFANAERVPSSGGVLEGTALETALALELRGKPLHNWRWSHASRYAVRDPTSGSSIHSWSSTASLEWFVLRQMGIGISADYVDQGGSDIDELNGSFTKGAVRLVWYPRGFASGQGRTAR